MSKTINIGILSTYYALYEDSIMTDVKLIIADGSYKCHRAILAGSSGYFKAMFQYGFEERNESEIKLPEIDSSIASLILAYMYGADIEVKSLELARNLYDLALLWNIKPLIDDCGTSFLFMTNEDNCCQIVSYSNFHTTRNGEKAINYIKNIFQHCLTTESIKDLSCNVLMKVLDGDNLNVTDEDCVLQAIKLWIDKDPENRETHLISLLSYARLIYASPPALLLLEVEYAKILLNSQTCMKMIEKMKNYYYFPEAYPKLYISQRSHYTKPEVRYCFFFYGSLSD